jgi:hypothetical protein
VAKLTRSPARQADRKTHWVVAGGGRGRRASAARRPSRREAVRLDLIEVSPAVRSLGSNLDSRFGDDKVRTIEPFLSACMTAR